VTGLPKGRMCETKPTQSVTVDTAVLLRMSETSRTLASKYSVR
jgi:hypothetical protein